MWVGELPSFSGRRHRYRQDKGGTAIIKDRWECGGMTNVFLAFMLLRRKKCLS
jgi:hypothetical protein